MNKFKKIFFANILAIAGWISFIFWLGSYFMFSSMTYEEMNKFDPSGMMDIVITEVFLKNILILFVILSLLLFEILIRKFFIKSKNKIENNDKTSSVFIKILSNAYNIFLVIGLFFGLLPICFLIFSALF